MSTYKQIKAEFERTGARAIIRRLDRKSLRRLQRPMAIDVASDRPGEYFDIRLSPDNAVLVHLGGNLIAATFETARLGPGQRPHLYRLLLNEFKDGQPRGLGNIITS